MSIVRKMFEPRKTVYELPLTRDYVRDWGVSEAVRELLQNALDAAAPMEVGFDAQGDSTTMRIRSPGAHLPVRTLLLGATTKAADDAKIGSFGEGYKLALLVLARACKSVRVHNDDAVWTPHFAPSGQFAGEEVLKVEAVQTESTGSLTFEIGGLTEEEVAGVVEMALALQGEAPLEGALATPYGNILPARPGKLYVGGLFVCDTGLVHGYDVLPRHLTLERDRNTVSSFDLQWLAKDAWFSTGQTERVAEMISENVADMRYAEHGAPEIVKEEVFKIFQRLHPGKIIAKSMDDLRRRIESGISKERIVYVGETFGGVARASSSYAERPEARIETPLEVLEGFFRSRRGEMRRAAIVDFKSVMDKARNWKVM